MTPSTGGGGGGVGDLGGSVSLSLRMASSDTWDRIPPVSDSMLESNSWGVAVPASTLLDRGTSSWSSSGGVAVVGKYIVSVGAARKPIYIYNKHITKLLKILIYLRY